MEIKKILQSIGINGNIYTKTEENSFFICYFDLFDRIMEKTNSDIELIIVDKTDFNTQIISISDNLYMIISYENIKSFDLLLNILFFPDGHNSQDNPFGSPENIFESLWNYQYKNENGEEIFKNKIDEENDIISLYKSMNAINIINKDSSNFLNYLKSLKNYSIGFEIFITFIISHEVFHMKSYDRQGIVDEILSRNQYLEAWLGSRADWIERHLFDLDYLLENESTINETTSDIGALFVLGDMYIDNGLIDKKILPIYLIVLFNNLFLFYLLNNRVNVDNINEITLRKSLCLSYIKSKFNIHENRLYYKLLCHIDSYLIQVVKTIAEMKHKNDPEYNHVLVQLFVTMKYIHEDYIPEGFDINQTNDINLLRKWIDQTAKELNTNE